MVRRFLNRFGPEFVVTLYIVLVLSLTSFAVHRQYQLRRIFLDIPRDCVLDTSFTKSTVCTAIPDDDHADCSHMLVHYSCVRTMDKSKSLDGLELKKPSQGHKPDGPHGRAAVHALGLTKTTGNFKKIEKARGKGAAIAAFQNALHAANK